MQFDFIENYKLFEHNQIDFIKNKTPSLSSILSFHNDSSGGKSNFQAEVKMKENNRRKTVTFEELMNTKREILVNQLTQSTLDSASALIKRNGRINFLLGANFNKSDHKYD